MASRSTSFAYYFQRSLTAEQFACSAQIALLEKIGKIRDCSLRSENFPDLLPDEQVANVKESLFLSNSPVMHDLLASSKESGHLIPRLEEMKDSRQQVNVLFEVMFTRSPDSGNHKPSRPYLKNEVEPPGARQVAWSMLTSGVQVQLTESLQLMKSNPFNSNRTANDRTCGSDEHTVHRRLFTGGNDCRRSVDGSFSGLFSIPALGEVTRQTGKCILLWLWPESI